MKKTTLLLAILTLAVSVPISANPIAEKINAYNALRKKDSKDSKGLKDLTIKAENLQTSSNPLPTGNPNDALMDARLVAALSLNYTTFKSLETVRDAFKSPAINDHVGYEDVYNQEKTTYDEAVKKISYSYLDQTSVGRLADSEIKIRNFANDDVKAYQKATPNATSKELEDIQSKSIEANRGLFTGLTAKYQSELQAVRDVFDVRMNAVKSVNRGDR